MINEDTALQFFTEATTDCHLTKEALRQFLTDTMESLTNRARVKHHLGICSQCQEALADETLALQKELHIQDDTTTTVKRQEFLQTLPAFNALMRRDQHVEALAKLLMPSEKLWMLPSLLKRIAETADTDSTSQEPAETLRPAAFAGVPSSAPEPWFQTLLCLPAFAMQMEDALVSRWSALQLDKGPLMALLEECIAAAPASRKWTPEIAAQVRDYYSGLILATRND
jgi:hypothetical protein